MKFFAWVLFAWALLCYSLGDGGDAQLLRQSERVDGRSTGQYGVAVGFFGGLTALGLWDQGKLFHENGTVSQLLHGKVPQRTTLAPPGSNSSTNPYTLLTDR